MDFKSNQTKKKILPRNRIEIHHSDRRKSESATDTDTVSEMRVERFTKS